MQLQILTGAGNVTISQRLGDGARGCRLDPGGLERAVGLVEAELDSGADVLILNKFGKQEAEGRGFRPLIGEALARDIPVLTAVAASNRAAFLEFCDGIATELPADAERLADWAVGSLGRRLALEEGDQVGPIPG